VQLSFSFPAQRFSPADMYVPAAYMTGPAGREKTAARLPQCCINAFGGPEFYHGAPVRQALALWRRRDEP